MEGQIGKIIHYYDKIGVAVVRLEGKLNVGDVIQVKGQTTDFEQTVDSMQVNHRDVGDGKKGDEVAVKLKEIAKNGDWIYRK